MPRRGLATAALSGAGGQQQSRRTGRKSAARSPVSCHGQSATAQLQRSLGISSLPMSGRCRLWLSCSAWIRRGGHRAVRRRMKRNGWRQGRAPAEDNSCRDTRPAPWRLAHACWPPRLRAWSTRACSNLAPCGVGDQPRSPSISSAASDHGERSCCSGLSDGAGSSDTGRYNAIPQHSIAQRRGRRQHRRHTVLAMNQLPIHTCVMAEAMSHNDEGAAARVFQYAISLASWLWVKDFQGLLQMS